MLRFKQFMLQEQKLKAEDYEAAIVIGWHNNNKKKLDVSSSGISLKVYNCLLYTSPSPRDATLSRMPSSA